MWQLIIQVLTLVAWVALIATLWLLVRRGGKKEAVRYAVTLRNNEGSFIGLCVEKRRNTWTFVEVRIMPTNPGAAVQEAAPGELYVPYRNILYYQEIANVAE